LDPQDRMGLLAPQGPLEGRETEGSLGPPDRRAPSAPSASRATPDHLDYLD